MPAPTLASRGFISLVITQFFGAANDNLLKGVITFMVINGNWRHVLGEGGQGYVMLAFTLPFILLSGFAGQFADRTSKRKVSIAVKVAEIPIVALAGIGFYYGSFWLTFLALIGLACQSAFFGPAKYGVIPELVEDHDLSRANGVINMLTNIAVIVGTLCAGTVSDFYDPIPELGGYDGPPMPWLPAVVLIVVAIAGLLSILPLPKLAACNPSLNYRWNPVGPYIDALREMAKSILLRITMAWGFFYMLAGMSLLIIPEYSDVLQIDREKASHLLGLLGVTIGLGSVVTGLLSGDHIRLGFVRWGGAGLALSFLLLGLVPPTWINVCIFVSIAGFSAGAYIIPLQSMLQHLSPDDERGRFLGAANGVSFAYLATGSLLFAVIRPWFGDSPQRIFIVTGVLMLVGGLAAVIAIHKREARASSQES